MATNNVNRITLKISTVFDKTGTLKEAQRLQTALNKQQDSMNKKREKGINSVTNAQNKNNNAIKDGSKATKSLGQNFADAFKKAVKGFIVLQLLLAITTQIRRAVTLAFELDKAFTNFAIVSKATASEIAQVDTEVGNLTKRLGALKAEVINTVTEFSRAGFSIQESLQLAETAIIGANVGMTSLGEVTTFLVAGLKAFRLEAEESTRILDVLFRVANTTAIDLSGIGEAFLRSANTLNTAGASLEESAALIAAANESIQNPAKIGSALNTIASRLRGVGVEGEAIPKLAESFRQVGIEIQNADGSFRDIFTIFEEFANIYEDLDEITRESLLEKLAGKRQKNVLIGLLTNFDTAKQAVEDASNSAGESAQAQEKFLQSLEGQAKLLKDAWNSLLETLRNSGAIEVVIKALTGVANALAFIVKNIPIVITGISGLTTAFIISSVKISGAMAVATGGISILIGLLATVAQGYVIFNKAVETSGEKIQSLNSELSTLRSNLQELESLENPTQAQQRRIDKIKERIDLTNELIEREQELDAIERRKTLATFGNAIEGGDFLSGSESSLLEGLTLLQKFQLEILKINETLSESSEAYKINAGQIEVLEKWIGITSDTLENEWGVVLPRSKKKTEELTQALTKLQMQQEATNKLFQESKGVLTLAEDIDKLDQALSELEDTGAISDDVLNDLLITFPDLIKQTNLTEESFRNYVEGVKSGSSEVIEAKKALARANIETAIQEIEILQALARANTQYSSSFLRDDFTAQQKLITDNQNLIGLLNNEISQIDSITKARNSSTTKQVKVLTELERALNEVNFQIEIQQKLLSRTDIPSEQIKINETLIDLYKQQKQVLIEQQAELESQRDTVVKGTEAYDDFIERSYDLSLAIEDSTNNIYALEQANKDLTRSLALDALSLQQQRIEETSDSIDSLRKLIGEMVKGEIQDEIDANKELIDSAKEQLDLKLKQLEAEKDLLDFQKSREKKEKDLNKINEQINSLKTASNQGDAKANAKLIELEEQRATIQESLDEEINERGFELRKESLENQFDEFEKNKQDEIGVLEDNLKDAELLAKMTNDRVNQYLKDSTESFYSNLVEWNTEYGTNFDNDVLSKWKELIELMKEASNTGMDSFSIDSFQQNMSDDATINQMKQNSLNWFTASQSERERLHQENQRLGGMIGANYDTSIGAWIKDGVRLYDNGGAFDKGDIALKNTNDTEWILKDNQISSIINDSVGKFVGLALGNMSLDKTYETPQVNINIEGNVSDDNVQRISNDVVNIIDKVSKGQLDAFRSQGIKSSTRIR